MKWLILTISFLSLNVLKAQNDIVFSQYLSNPAYYNPAFIAAESQSFSVMQFRSQWTGYQATFDTNAGAPLTQSFTGIIPIDGTFSGFGVIATNDQIGPVNNIIVGLPLSFSFRTSMGMISLGANAMIYSQSLNFNLLRFVNPQDPLNIGTKETQIKPNLTTGILLEMNNGWNIGLSSLNLFEPIFDYGLDSLSSQLKRSYSVMTMKQFSLGRKISIIPNLHLRTDLSTFTFDLGGQLKMASKAWAGLNYRYQEALVLFVGYALLPDNRLQIGYSLDYVIDERNAKQPTSQEFLIRYNLPNLVIGGRKQVKTPRFAY